MVVVAMARDRGQIKSKLSRLAKKNHFYARFSDRPMITRSKAFTAFKCIVFNATKGYHKKNIFQQIFFKFSWLYFG